MAAIGIALIGAFGALLGVIVTEAARKRRDEEAANVMVRSAERMVSAELGMSAISIDSTRTGGVGCWDPSPLQVGPSTGRGSLGV
jgi:hypothetical protein